MVPDRYVAWSQLEFHPLGAALFSVADAGKVPAAGVFAEAAHVAAARIYPAGGVRWVGGVCHGGSDCLRPILQNLLWRRDALERGGRLLPDGLWPDAGDSGSRLYPLGEERLEPAAGTGKRCPWPGADAGGAGGLHGLSGGRQL